MMQQKRYWVIFSVLVTCVIVGGLSWWIYAKKDQALFENALDAQTQLSVIALLDQHHIGYKMIDNKILVDAQAVAMTRNLIASQGITQPQPLGYELFDQSEYGLSEFSQKIKLQRALEGELARSIGQLEHIRYARVHLTPEQTSIYQSQRAPAKAVVILHMINQQQVTNSQVLGMQQLVSSAVQGLGIDQVLVLDDSGRVLSGSDGQVSGGQSDTQHQIELRLKEKAVALLQAQIPINPNQIAVSVALNFDKVTSNVKKPVIADFGLVPVRRKDVVNQSQATQTPDSSQSQSTKEAEYVFGEEQTNIQYAPYNIEQISVALMLQQALTQEEKSTLAQALFTGLGLNKTRGDTIEVAYLPTFTSTSTSTSTSTQPVPQPITPPVPISTAEPTVELYAFGVVGLLMIGGFVAVYTYQQKKRSLLVQPKPLTPQEREQLLQEFQTWLYKD